MRVNQKIKVKAMNEKTCPKKKQPAIAGLLTIIFGPFGYLYLGWRYALVAIICVVLFVILFSFILFIPSWFKYVNVIILAVWAVAICKIWNKIVEAKHPDGFMLNTFPVAVFAMTSLLPLLATVDTVAIGIFVAIRTMFDGRIGKGLIVLFLATPFISFVHYFVSGLIAAGIDKLVLLFNPEAPLNIFPTAIGHGRLS
jgi:hypothetical protein